MRASIRLLCWCWGIIAGLVTGFAHAGYGPVSVPQPLEPWRGWVMHDQATYPCPFSPQDYSARVCAWPTSLHLDIEARGASFAQHWQVYQAGYLALPGGDKVWPQSVMLNGAPAAIVMRDQRPWVYAQAGAVEIRGRFEWANAPDAVPLPPDTALLTVTRNGQRLAFPNLDAEGRFWLKQPQTEQAQAPAQEEQITVRVYRRLNDNVPFEVETLVETEVSGKPREMLLGPALLPGYQLRAFEAQLPARLEEGGQLRVQLRAGLWQFRVTGHLMGAVTRVEKPVSAAPWPDDEIWVFSPQNALRTVRVENVDALDPQQTTLPPDWRQWQAYRVTSAQPLDLAVIRRGDPEPAPNQLSLTRMLWLDFDGGGWTIQDDFNGQVNREWRMQGDGQMALGEVSVNGQPQVITRLQGADNDGVEVRDAQLRLQAVSRLEGEGAPRHWEMSVSGWQEDFQSMSARVHLPPGWRLLAASGVDNAYPTWLGEWSVWDVFLLLIAVAAVGKVIGWRWGAVALIALGLIYPESPVLLFLVLNVVAAIALARLLEAGNLRTLLETYVRLSAFVLVMVTLPFVVQQVRLALYPQLENPYTRISDASRYDYDLGAASGAAEPAAEFSQEAATMAPAPMMSDASSIEARERVGVMVKKSLSAPNLQQQIDPQQAAQTGPGLPRWRWQSAELSWSGPVVEGQTLGLWLLGPTENRVLALVRVLLLAALVAALLGVGRMGGRWRWNPDFLRGRAPSVAGLAGLLIAMLVVTHSTPAKAEAAPAEITPRVAGGAFPDNALLERLQERLWAARDCTPDCLGIERVDVQIDGARLTLNLTVGALEEVELALPDSQGQWQPQTAIIDGAGSLAMRKDAGRYLLAVPKGSQRITLSGPLRARDSFQLSFALPAHNVSVQAPGWTVQGIDQGQLQGGALLFAPDVVEKQQEEAPTLTQAAAPAFVQVNRNLRLGLTWQVVTRVQRIAPLQGAIQLEIPLLAGESVITRDIEVAQGKARVALTASQDSLEWASNLEPADQLTFTAADTAQWTEVWTAEISPLWHVEFKGIDALKSQYANQWQPAWQPYPGESLTLNIQKPVAKPGATTTIDQVTLSANPGARESSYSLDLHVRTSKGGEQRITLPEGLHLTQVLLDGQPQASEETNPQVVLQVAPGAHDLSLAWRSSDAIGSRWITPVISLANDSEADAVARNVDITVNVPESRWVLFVGGPAIGPAVLFWGMALVLIAVAVVLGKLSMSPLRSWQWVLLVLGFSTGSWWGLAAVTLWFFALAWREKQGATLSENHFNLVQLGLVGLSILALIAFIVAIPQGLLGTPDMDIVGNASNSYQLNWYQDVMQQTVPQAWVVSVPLWAYRALMLAWSLWVAVAMLRWLPWAWRAYSQGGYWRNTPRKPRPSPGRGRAAQPAPTAPAQATSVTPVSADAPAQATPADQGKEGG